MNLRATVKELESEKDVLTKRILNIDAAIAALGAIEGPMGRPMVLDGVLSAIKAVKRPLVAEPRRSRRNPRTKKICLNCGKGYLTSRPGTSKFHSDRCRGEWNNLHQKQERGTLPKRSKGLGKGHLDPNSKIAKVIHAINAGAPLTRHGEELKHERTYSLFCQDPTCGKPFKSAKPWARWCPDSYRHRTTLTKKYPLSKAMAYRMTANEPPKPLTPPTPKPVKLMVGDPLRAGGPDGVR